ncbi:interferon [Klebsormidium nitens]|uniref:Interferon n=1 Tax=Klebsormidium nitens TaxID=105231 RepID=A0A1Y1IBG1_KLENI|nr:interferon [Klebsormidium nitens]|eukprot:GAQ88305.1 interferon [Klebsormidium nitens]
MATMLHIFPYLIIISLFLQCAGAQARLSAKLFEPSVLLSKSSTPSLVNVTLYEEALCPDCAEFITGPLTQMFQNGLSAITTLTIIPYGNAKLIGGSIRCQHGPDECTLDRIEACVIDFYPDTHSWFSFISCVEQQPAASRLELWPQCGVALGLDVIGIQNCADGEKGAELEARNRKLTESLDPPHRFVPWVTVDGAPLYEDLDSFFERICEAYKGTEKPETCARLDGAAGTYPSSRNLQLWGHVE